MRRLALIVLAVAAILPVQAMAQTYGQPYYSASPAPYGQPYGGPVVLGFHGQNQGYGQGYGYSQSYGYGQSGGSAYGDPRAYRPPVQYGYGYGHRYDRGGRYGYSPRRSGEWTRWSSPPGRGYHDVYGYNDDRSPRGDCDCTVGAYLYDR